MAYYLKVLKGPNNYLNQVYELQYNLMTIGREVGNDVVIVERSVSRFHCNLWWEDDCFMLEDLGSTNGTLINGQPSQGAQRLNPEDVISLGRMVTFQYIQTEDALKPMHTSPFSAAFDKTIADVREIEDLNSGARSSS